MIASGSRARRATLGTIFGRVDRWITAHNDVAIGIVGGFVGASAGWGVVAFVCVRVLHATGCAR